ncbi:hypothetical protein ScPMuIL_003537 [Solemya velum]
MAAPIYHMFKMRRIYHKIWTVLKNRKCYSSSATSYILRLHERGIFQSIFPPDSSPELARILSSPQCVYSGFDPTADSLHIGNLLAVISLIHCQRGGHHPVALVGSATALIGDPSGRDSERVPLSGEQIQSNTESINSSLHRIFTNHERFIWANSKKVLPKVRIVNNSEWYRDKNIIEFLSTVGRYFRMGPMLSRHSVQTRLTSAEGMSFTEFTYQLFQSFDWLHLLRQFNCKIQIGGNDQLGNITSGYELITRVTEEKVFGLTVPLVTSETGDKLGKSAGNAVWLNADRTSPYELYQFYINLPDSSVEKFLKLFTFLSDSEITDIMKKQKLKPDSRVAQKKVAEQVVMLVHGETGLDQARRWTEALWSGKAESLVNLDQSELQLLFKNAPTVELLPEPDLTVCDMCMKAGCFPTESDADRIIKAGGLYINHRRVTEPDFILVHGEHILPNNVSLIRVGKKNYYVVKWLS